MWTDRPNPHCEVIWEEICLRSVSDVVMPHRQLHEVSSQNLPNGSDELSALLLRILESPVPISAVRPTILADSSRDFPQFLHGTT